jgi:hypothetical protein
VSFDLLDLLRVPPAVQTEHNQPLVAIDLAQSDVRKEVIPQIAVGGRGELNGALARGEKLGQ